METRTYKVNLRNNYYNALSVGLSQYDTGVILDFEVYDGAEKAVFDEGTTATIQGVRPSGVGFNMPCALNDNVVSVSTTTDMTGEYGEFPVELRFYGNGLGVDVGTVNFIFQIEKAAHPDGTIDADITRQVSFIERLETLEENTVTDPTLSISGRPADAEVTGERITAVADEVADTRVGADGTVYRTVGEAVRGQIRNIDSDVSVLNEAVDTLNEGGLVIKDDVIASEIDSWLNDHPEATTTVQDGAITNAKIANGTITKNKFDENVNVLLNGYGVKKVSIGLRNWAQDASAYNGKVFGVGTSTGVLKVYDFATKELIASSTLSGEIKPHGNAVSFGNKLNVADTYPLFYVTGYNGLDAGGDPLPRGTCCVYKILDNYETNFVQEIRIDFADDELWLGTEAYSEAIRYGNYIVDTDSDRLYLFSSLCENRILKTRLFEFNIPSTNSASVILTQADILNYYDLPFYPYLQGAEYYDHKLYIAFGGNGNTGLAVVDLEAHTQLGCIALGDIINEPEAVIQVDGDIYVAEQSFYKLSAIPFESNVGDLTQLKTFKNKTIVEAINSMNEVEDFTDKVTNRYDLNNGKFLRCGKLVTISYQGVKATHSDRQVLFTLPEGYRPSNYEYITATKAGAVMTLRIDATGNAIIWLPPSTASVKERIYFSHSFICNY